MKKEFGISNEGSIIPQSLEALKLALVVKDINTLKQSLENSVLKYPGPGMRKVIARRIINRYIQYDKETGVIKKTPLLIFINSSIPLNAKIHVLYYIYSLKSSVFSVVFTKLLNSNSGAFNRKEIARLASEIIGSELKGTRLIALISVLVDFALLERRRDKGKTLYIIRQNKVPKEAFLFVLHEYFLSKGSVVPKTLDIKKLFKELYNQPEAETEKLLRDLSREGWWTIERIAHLDQIALTHNFMDRFMEAFLKKYQGIENGSNILSRESKS